MSAVLYDVSHPLGGYVNVRGPIKVKSEALVMAQDEGPAGLVVDALMLLDSVERAETFDRAESGYFVLKDGREYQVVVTPIERAPASGLPEGVDAVIATFKKGGERATCITDLVRLGMARSAAEDAIEAAREERRHFYTSESCPSKHWNDGADYCADCGENLNA